MSLDAGFCNHLLSSGERVGVGSVAERCLGGVVLREIGGGGDVAVYGRVHVVDALNVIPG